ncbi:site-specific integrase [Pseudalkalibacillus decolorationis]|uniref:site-specific integrase n=1 Tax=Pseudalkalibacillus decolorationis TaxID=163879 RepID=UPI002148DB9E|nr:site-specific integrase [Pseudalkalibacillus decolorationis]
MQKKVLKELMIDLEQELLRLGYTKGSMNFYKRRWKMLLEFADTCGELYYTERLGINFIETCFNILEKDFDGTLTQSEVQNLRVIRMLGDFQLHGTILRRYYKHKEILHNPYFIEVINNFKRYCIDRDYSVVTIGHYSKQAAKFLDFVDSQSLGSCSEINLAVINNYIKTLAGYSYKTVEQILCSLRALFKFLYLNGLTDNDYSLKVPMIQARKQTRIPSVWSEENFKKLIAAIDRGNPTGKRDYAIIFLVSRLGLRCSDIKKLTLENFRWEDKQLVFVQSKTRTILSLPLTQDVGWAVIDYLRYGRPKVDSSYVFIRHLAPFLPFSEEDHLHQIIAKYMKMAHIPKGKKKVGMHSLRHTLASMLLEKDTPLPAISEILGHVNTESTAVYLKVDIEKLKECPLDLQEDTVYE